MPADHFLADLHHVGNMLGMPPGAHSLADSIKHRCPVCEKPVAGLYNRVAGLNNEIMPVDPPRCKTCMMQWVEQKFGSSPHSSIAEPTPSFSPDTTKAEPMSPTEFDFFQQFEQQMEDFKP